MSPLARLAASATHFRIARGESSRSHALPGAMAPWVTRRGLKVTAAILRSCVLSPPSTLPDMEKELNEMGLKEGVDYHLVRQPAQAPPRGDTAGGVQEVAIHLKACLLAAATLLMSPAGHEVVSLPCSTLRSPYFDAWQVIVGEVPAGPAPNSTVPWAITSTR